MLKKGSRKSKPRKQISSQEKKERVTGRRKSKQRSRFGTTKSNQQVTSPRKN